VHAASELVLGREIADCFAHRESEQLAHAQGRCEGKRSRAAAGDRVKIERDPYADHALFFYRLRGAACRRGVGISTMAADGCPALPVMR